MSLDLKDDELPPPPLPPKSLTSPLISSSKSSSSSTLSPPPENIHEFESNEIESPKKTSENDQSHPPSMSPANIFFSQDVKPKIQNSEKPKISPKPIIREASTESEVFEESKINGIVPPHTEKQPQMDPLRLIYIIELYFDTPIKTIYLKNRFENIRSKFTAAPYSTAVIGSISRRNVPRVPKSPVKTQNSSNLRNQSIFENHVIEPEDNVLQNAVPKSAAKRKETSIGSVSIATEPENIGDLY